MRTRMKTLKPGQHLRLSTWPARYFVRLNTARAYAGDEAHDLSVLRGHPTVWAIQGATVIAKDGDRSGEAAKAAATVVDIDEIVKIEGETGTFKVTVDTGNIRRPQHDEQPIQFVKQGEK